MAVSHPFLLLLLRLSNHFAAYTAVIVFPHAVEIGVVQVALNFTFVIFRTSVPGKRAFCDNAVSPWFCHVKAFVNHAVTDLSLIHI